MLNNSPRSQSGLTLIELMISITIGLVVTTSLVFLIASTMRTNTQTLRATQLNQELRAVMQMITRDLRRAGHWDGADNRAIFLSQHTLTLSGTTGNITITPPAGVNYGSWAAAGITIMGVVEVGGADVISCADVTAATTTSLSATVAACPGAAASVDFPGTTLEPGGWTALYPALTTVSAADVADDPVADTEADCVLFSYDRHDTGTRQVLETSERFGFRLDPGENAIEIGSSVTSCTAGSWQNLTDNTGGVEITDFDVAVVTTTNSGGSVDVDVREIQLTLTGRLASDNTVTRTITESVKIRNDQITS